MARIPYKHLVLASLFLLFISTTAGARNLPPAANMETEKPHHHQELASTKDEGAPGISVEELVSMDYTPATRTPPIHN
ncbi:root meristem growth factor 9, GOLVEN 2, CLE-like 9 [Hibiscus trionum]|uniref:Root meristem growth factor 9, GOLVEN 2, CLE-like 9 n=1 Tax=Hibiscus trionum TaxID=183268 RepID=A0A9W7I0B4_HIBTR|nr:root meristem growth factor 9, GOLVEN 2, CLE-like 9 [Hibiscus trionum]